MLLPFQQSARAGLILAALLPLAAPAPAAAEGIGWRTDGSGSYPKAQPPLAWSPTKNVVWRTAMPGYGVSQPVLLGQRLFICAEPCVLLCLDRDDGKILWQKNSSYAELEIDPDVRARLEVELAETAVLDKQQAAVRKELDGVRRALVKEKAPKEEVAEKVEPFNRQINELNREKQKRTLAVRYTQPRTHSTAGYSAPTPVTNGQDVFVVFGNGLVACFDLDGQRKWLKLIEHSNASFAHSGSPVLVGDKLVVHYTDLVALDTKTGAEAWRLKLPTSHGTSLATRIGDMDILLTPRGAMVRARDGKLLASGLGSCGANSPVLHDRTIYYVHGAANAVRLPESIEEPGNKPAKIPALWKSKVKGGGYGFSSPVVHDGLLYAANDQGILSVLDAATGKPVYEERLNLRGSVYPSISAAGNRIYVSSDTGTTVVLEAGREYRELARNELEPLRSSLVFDGRRVYIRTAKNLYCIEEQAVKPADKPAATTAIPAAAFLDSIGVVTTYPDRGQPVPRTVKMLKYGGFRWVRGGIEGLTAKGPTTLQTYLDLHRQTGVRFSWGLVSGGTDVPKLIDTGRQLAKAGALLAFEGNNEPNNWGVTYQGKKGGGKAPSWRAVAELQRDLYHAVKGDPVLKTYPVWSISENGAEVDNVGLQFLTIPKGASTLLPAGTVFADYANVHNYIYHPNSPGLADNKTWNAADPTKACKVDGLYGNYGVTWAKHFPGYSEAELLKLPRVTTETGTTIGGSVTEEIHGLNLLSLYLDQFKRGWSYTAVYLLRDRQDEAGNQRFGFFGPDYRPRKAAVYLHNLTTILADQGKLDKPGALAYTIPVQPATVHDLLLQKSNGTFALVVWDERIKGSDTVTVRLGRPYTEVQVYDPTAGTEPVQTLAKVDALKLTLSDHPLIITIGAQ